MSRHRHQKLSKWWTMEGTDRPLEVGIVSVSRVINRSLSSGSGLVGDEGGRGRSEVIACGAGIICWTSDLVLVACAEKGMAIRTPVGASKVCLDPIRIRIYRKSRWKRKILRGGKEFDTALLLQNRDHNQTKSKSNLLPVFPISTASKSVTISQ